MTQIATDTITASGVDHVTTTENGNTTTGNYVKSLLGYDVYALGGSTASYSGTEHYTGTENGNSISQKYTRTT